MTWVKMCGITTSVDARRAVDAGADALGFVFTESRRQVDPGRVSKIADAVRGGAPPMAAGTRGPVEFVGVFTGEPIGLILDIGEAVGLDAIQLHTARSEADARRVREAGYRVLQGVRVRDAGSLSPWMATGRQADAVLLDAWSSLGLGGTGERFDWRLLEGGGEAAGRDALEGLRPVILAGGLNPSNVREALERLSPDGVDVSTGVEGEPGTKDAKLMRQFVSEVRAHDGNRSKVDTRRLA